MTDKIEKIGKGTVIQHGRMNNRIYLMKLDKDDFPNILTHIFSLAKINSYTKIFCKVPEWATPAFISEGFMIEAYIPRFYNNRTAVFFMSKFLNSDRLLGIENEKLKSLSKLLSEKTVNNNSAKLMDGYVIHKLTHSYIRQMQELYQQVFESYPFPIQQAEYLQNTMQNGVQYFGVERSHKLVALSSAEIDKDGSNAEMTDFATDPKYRGKKLSVLLLREMEKSMQKQEISTLYTIARLNSVAMNKTFLSSGYLYAGTLLNNTNISGKIESMNVLYKHINHEAT